MSAELPFPASDGDRAEKSASAFRTISEVADELSVPQHVLRFWETKFNQIRPLKRGGGRRYYRPEDIEMLRRVKTLLYVEGYTIKGVQKLLRQGANKARGEGAVVQPLPVKAAPPPPEKQAPTAAPPASKKSLPDATRRRIQAVLTELEACRDLLDKTG